MPHWKSTLEPYATRWRSVVQHARDRGLIHGMTAHTLVDPGPGLPWTPADTALFLRCMVEDGAITPVRKDLAGAGHSIRAFRGLQYLREKPESMVDVASWLNGGASADAHLWTYRAGPA